MGDLSEFCCQNYECVDYGRKGLGNLSWCGWSGHNHQKRYRMIRCRTCQEMFSMRKGTPLFGTKLPEQKALAVLKHIGEGCGTRQTSRLVGVSKNTVTQFARKAGAHAKAMHDEKVAVSPSDARGTVRREMVVRGVQKKDLRGGRRTTG